MTIKEAIAILKSIRPPTGEQFPYRAEMTAYEMAIAALEKQEGKEAPFVRRCGDEIVADCPVCGARKYLWNNGSGKISFHCACGQKIYWTEGE